MSPYEYIKIIAVVSSIVGAIFGIPLRFILKRYDTIIGEHTAHHEQIIELNLNRVELQGKISAMESSKISRPELDQRMEKFEKAIIDQLRYAEKSNKEDIKEIKDDIKEVNSTIQSQFSQLLNSLGHHS